MNEADARPTNFIRQIIDEDLATGKHVSQYVFHLNRIFIYIGHESICLNFGIAKDYQGQCNYVLMIQIL